MREWARRGEEAKATRRTPGPVSEESHLDEMNEAIRAQRERGAVPRSMLPPEDEPPETPSNTVLLGEREARRGLVSRLLRRGEP